MKINIGRWNRAALALCVAGWANAQVTEVPLQELLAAQGQSGSTFFAPIPDHLGWAQAYCKSGGLSCLAKFDPARFCLGNFALVDYAGLTDKLIKTNYGDAASSGTVVTGNVFKRPLGGGLVEVAVSLHTKNALTFVMAPSIAPAGAADACGNWLDFASGAILLGYRANELPPRPLADRALGDSYFHVKFVNGALDPLPDLLMLFNTRYADIREYSFHAVATGPLTAAFGAPGAMGKVTIMQAGNGARSNIQPAVVRIVRIGR